MLLGEVVGLAAQRHGGDRDAVGDGGVDLEDTPGPPKHLRGEQDHEDITVPHMAQEGAEVEEVVKVQEDLGPPEHPLQLLLQVPRLHGTVFLMVGDKRRVPLLGLPR